MINVYLADLTHETVTVSSDTMPLNVGFLSAYLQKHFHKELRIHLFKSPAELLQKIKEQTPHILGLSNYCWNFELSNLIFNHIKELNPKVTTVMGGPNFPKEHYAQESFLRSNASIDFYIIEEGELSYCDLVMKFMDTGRSLDRMKIDPIKGCLFISPETKCLISGGMYQRIKEIDDIPSPYLTGIMDKFFGSKLNPFIQTNRGCPYSCTYCHEGEKYYSDIKFFGIDRINEELDYIRNRVKEQSVITIADSNFGMYKRDVEISRKIRDIQDSIGYPQFINATTGKNRPDLILEVMNTLKPGTLTMSASVQSLEPKVLENINRKNIEWGSYIKIQKQLHQLDPNYLSISDVILPLPGETKESHFMTLRKLINSGVDQILPYTLMMLEGTKLNTLSEREKYGIKTKFRVVPRSFGEYEGKKCFEIEEVGVAHKDMSFDDYKLCRKMALLIFLAYNKKNFKELIKYMKDKEVDVFKWILSGCDSSDKARPIIKEIFNGFIQETEGELWDSREELIEFYNSDKNYKRLLNGEIGGNLLQKYWVKGIIFNFEELANYLFDVALDLILTVSEMSMEDQNSVILELNNIKRYILIKRNNLFDLNDKVNGGTVDFDFDIKNWEEGKKGRKLNQFKKKKVFRASRTLEQERILEKLFQQYGKSTQTIGKISTRINIQKLWRDVFPAATKKN